MSESIELPHTSGCLVCGRHNSFGLKLSLFVNPETGVVSVDFAPRQEHIGFEGIVHGGMLATVIDEAMVWAATWSIRRFCVCGEMSVRFRRPATVGEMLKLEAHVEFSRPRLIQTAATIRSADGGIVASGGGKYVPMAPEKNEQVLRTFVREKSTRAAGERLGIRDGDEAAMG